MLINAIKALAITTLMTSASCATKQKPVMANNDDTTTNLVMLTRQKPTPCLSLVMNNARIVMSMTQLQELDKRRPATWNTEQERMALISGDRARELLSAATTESDVVGCLKIEPANLGESQYLVSSLLESDQANLYRVDHNEPQDRVLLRRGKRVCPTCPIQGDVNLYLVGEERPFISLVTSVK